MSMSIIYLYSTTSQNYLYCCMRYIHRKQLHFQNAFETVTAERWVTEAAW